MQTQEGIVCLGMARAEYAVAALEPEGTRRLEDVKGKIKSAMLAQRCPGMSWITDTKG